MFHVNFDTLSIVLALHIDPEMADDMNEAYKIKDKKFYALIRMASTVIYKQFYFTYREMSQDQNESELDTPDVFCQCVNDMLEKRKFDNIGQFVKYVHDNKEHIKEELHMSGIEVTYLDGGVSIRSFGALSKVPTTIN